MSLHVHVPWACILVASVFSTHVPPVNVVMYMLIHGLCRDSFHIACS